MRYYKAKTADRDFKVRIYVALRCDQHADTLKIDTINDDDS